jgi:phosphoenolpyruvate carboxykinase (ATP)
MSPQTHDLEAYRKFAEELPHALSGSNVRSVDLKWLEPRAKSVGIRTRQGSYGWRAAISSRIAPRTIYLGTPAVQLPSPSPDQATLIAKAPEELDKVLHLLRTFPFYHLKRQMGHNDSFNPICNLYVSEADLINYRLGYMWGSTLFNPGRRPGPEITMIHIPEEHPLRQQVLVLPEYNLNIALGTDYMGEDKKGFLRQAMWQADREGMLGLHAGTKIVTARGKDGKLKTYGVFLFGLSATGKSTWSCHQLGLDHKQGEQTLVTQDDICFLCRDGSALGSENNFFVKTDVEKQYQEAMYNALVDKSALLENVMIKANGEIDFMDESLTANGRAILQRKKLKVKIGGRMVDIFSKSIDLPPLEELDGLIFAFITRRNTIMTFAQELTPEQAVLAYLWGESTHSYASQPLKAGESVRIVGTDPFIIGSRAQKVNRLYEILMTLEANHPGKLKCMQYNTGGMGEIIETLEEGDRKQKRLVRKVKRVPINLMAEIQRGDLRGTNTYEKGRLGTRAIVRTKEQGLDDWDARRFYSSEQIEGYVADLVEGRRKYTAEIAAEGLRDEVLHAAERSYRIDSSAKGSKVAVPGRPEDEEPDKEAAPELPREFKSRPRRDSFWRSR